jgi:hypothetical protein
MKTGLHFEFFVSAALERAQFSVNADFPFSHVNERGETIERSVDFEVTDYISPSRSEEISGRLQLMVECKSAPGSKWVFSPYTNPEIIDGLERQVVAIIDDFGPWEIEDKKRRLILPNIPACIRGETLSEAADQIKSATYQLRYGALAAMEQSLRFVHFSEDFAWFFGLILVTDADLYVLDANLSDLSFRSARHFHEIAKPVDALALAQPWPGPELMNSIEAAVLKILEARPEILPHLKARATARLGGVYLVKDEYLLRNIMAPALTDVFVVRYSALPGFLGQMRAAVKAVLNERKRIGKSIANEQGRFQSIEYERAKK